MTKKLYLTIFFIGFVTLISCKKETSHESFFFTKKEMLEDYKVFQSIYKKANTGLYKYRKKNEIDSVFNLNKRLITSKLTPREFYNILWNVVDYTGSCHNSLAYSDSLDKKLSKQKIFFPLPLKQINGKLYANLQHTDISVGNQIISINNIHEKELLRRISKYVSTDGFNKTGKYANLETDWLPFYIYLALGKQNNFQIKFKTKSYFHVKKVTLKSVTYAGFYKNYKKRFSKKYEDRKSKKYNYKFLNSINTGYLEVTTFNLGGVNSKNHKLYKKFLDSIFKNLKIKKVPNLIVDVRGNGGGNDPNDLLLYSYLTKRKFQENKTAFSCFNKIPLKEYYVYDDVEKLEKELKEEYSILKNNKFYQSSKFNKVWLPNKNSFNGKIILLIDPFVASAGSLFASLVKSDANTLVIGEESLGGYYGHTGHIPVTYQLPNSKFDVTFSIIDLEQDVERLSDQKFGNGVKPDIKVIRTSDDFLIHKDTQLNFAINKIKNSN